jgi:hypothetical protein
MHPYIPSEVYFGPAGYTSTLQPSSSKECWNGELFQAFRKFVWNRAGAEEVHPGDKVVYKKPTITVIYRRDYKPHPRSDGKNRRKIRNEDECMYTWWQRERQREAGNP